MSDSIAVMNKGRIEQIGSPRDIYDRPATRFVASFIGNANIVEVSVEGTAGETSRVRVGGIAFEVPRLADPSADKAHVALRYERIKIGAEAAGLMVHLTAHVRDVIFTGPPCNTCSLSPRGRSSLSRKQPMKARNPCGSPARRWTSVGIAPRRASSSRSDRRSGSGGDIPRERCRDRRCGGAGETCSSRRASSSAPPHVCLDDLHVRPAAPQLLSI